MRPERPIACHAPATCSETEKPILSFLKRVLPGAVSAWRSPRYAATCDAPSPPSSTEAGMAAAL